MSITRFFVRVAGALALVGAAASCDHEAEVFMPPPVDPLFESYVAIGNSITAGYQSGGINASTQAQSYAVLLSRQMRTRFAFPALALPGCSPPVVNWQTGARLGGATAPPCALRDANSATDILNNVAVPGAASTEVNAATSQAHNTLTTLFLGGKTQVGRAIEASPTFATIWIGNNDVLEAAGTGLLNLTTVQPPGGALDTISRGMTALDAFRTNYTGMLTALTAGAPRLEGGVLIGVVQTANAPLLFPVGVLLTSAAYRAGFDQAAGYNPASSDPYKASPLTIDASCGAAPTTLVSFAIVPQIAAFRNDSVFTSGPNAGQPKLDPRTRAGHPPLIQCGSTEPEGPTPGHIFILTPEEQATLAQRVADYNAHIQAKAAELGWAYYDPNDLLEAQRIPDGCIALVPNLAADAVTGAPFGTCISFDGVHPSAAGHLMIANALIGVINEHYDTSLPAVP